MIDFKILLLDDDFNVRQQIIDKLVAIGIAEPAIDPPWRVSLGDQVLNVDCPIITDKEQLKREFTPGNLGAALRSADLILLDNDWHHGEIQLGVEVLGKSGWRRGVGPVLAIFTSATTYRPEFVKKALDAGADALVYKDETTHLINLLMTALDRKLLLSKWTKLGDILSDSDSGLVSKSPAMRRFLAEAARVAVLKNEAVLIVGQVGSGKTRLAKAMHGASPRARSPFQTINPGQISDSLLQAELFGVERGAFTGAVARKGQIELAVGGTVFIDEIESMTKDMQAALLNVIETRTYVRPGDPREHPIDVRFMFATNVQDLGTQRDFRRDLLSRINANILTVPNLSARSEDIPDLATSFVQSFYADNFPGVPPPAVTADAIEALRIADFPDNVRGLLNAVRRSLIHLPKDSDLDACHLLLSKPPGDSAIAVRPEDIGALLDCKPRTGSQRAVFDRLVAKLPETVTYQELNGAIGADLVDVATEPLMIAVSRLRDRLNVGGFSIRQDKTRKGYALIRVLEHA